jgi:very-short-patch-repair endonuclease
LARRAFRFGSARVHTLVVHHNPAAAVMARQFGIITWDQAREADMSPRQIEVRRRRGEWITVHNGVYRHASTPASFDQRLLAAVLAAGPGSAVSHRAAVAKWGLYGFGSRLVEISRPSPVRQPLESVMVHRMPDLRRPFLTTLDTVPITTPARTLVDLGMVMSGRQVARCTERWLADRVVSLADLRAALDAHAGKGRKGVGVLRRALEDRVLGDAVADSSTEALFADVLAGHGVPLPVHHQIVLTGYGVVELDYAYVEERVALEVDGYGVHLRSREAFEDDRLRQNALSVLGWHVLRFTHRMIVRQPGIVAGTVARMLRQRRTDGFTTLEPPPGWMD